MKIGFIGLGTMGRGIAANFQKAGYALVVNDLTEQAAAAHLKAGAIWAETPGKLAEQCDVVFTSLPTPKDVDAVGFGPSGLMTGFREGAAWFDLTTNSVADVRNIHGRLAEKGIAFLDAPVSGGPAGAASGKMAIWVGGDRAVYDRCKPLLDAIADQPRYIGAIGAGSIAKLTHNMATTALYGIMGEVMSMGIKAGLEPLQLWEAIRGGAGGRMRTFDSISRRFLQGKLDPPSFALRLAQKDVALALQLAREVDVPMQMCDLVAKDIEAAMERGWAGRDCQSFLLLQQERAGIAPIAIPEDQITQAIERT